MVFKGNKFYKNILGATVRAHIQNIDLVPVRDRAPSPSEALRADYQDSFQDSRDEQLR